jgi:hypothetical protein
VEMESAARQVLPWMWDRGASTGFKSSGGDDEGNAAADVGGAGRGSGLMRFGAGADEGGGAALPAKQPNMSSSMAW